MLILDVMYRPENVEQVRKRVAEFDARQGEEAPNVTAQSIDELRGFAKHIFRGGAALTASQIEHVCDLAQLYRFANLSPELDGESWGRRELLAAEKVAAARDRLEKARQDPAFGEKAAKAIGELRLLAARLVMGGDVESNNPVLVEQLRLVCDLAHVYEASPHEALQMTLSDSFETLVKAQGLENTIGALLDTLPESADAQQQQLRRDLLQTLVDYRARLDA